MKPTTEHIITALRDGGRDARRTGDVEMNTELIRKLTVDLDTAMKHAADLRREAGTLQLNHQEQIAVSVPGCHRIIHVAVNGGHGAGWMTRMVRGREMIMLGIKKAYAAMIEAADDRVAEIEAAIAKAVS